MARNDIDDAMLLELLIDVDDSEGLKAGDIARALALGKGRTTQVRHRLQELTKAGLVVRDGRRYFPSPRLRAAGSGAEALAGDGDTDDFAGGAGTDDDAPNVGTLHVSSHGRAYLDRGEAYERLRIARGARGGAIDGDMVEVRLTRYRGRDQGRVTRVIERGRKRLTGVLHGGPPWEIEPDDPRLPAPVLVRDAADGEAGEVVLGGIVGYPDEQHPEITVDVTQRLGEPGDLLTEIAKVLAENGIAEIFPAEVRRAPESMPTHVRTEDLVDRVDLRDRHFVTIDPRTARDFDDAVAVEPGPDGTTRVWVAVADVSHYVAEGSAIDAEARRRGCSVYLPDRAIPMLPEPLSANICSLVPRQDRLAMVVRLDVAPDGGVSNEAAMAAVIHSRGRLDYDGVAAALEGDFRGRRAAYREYEETLHTLKRVAGALRRRRLERGSLDLDLPEARVVLDEDDPRRVRDIIASRADAPIKRAYNLIEEMMIAANEAIGRLFEHHEVPTLWRIHPGPHEGALKSLVGWMGSYGVRTTVQALQKPAGMSKLLARLKDLPARRPLTYLVLRALKQASYAVDNVGHFGLASKTYLHFTSPIRRFPDLEAHRLLKRLLRAQGAPAGGRHVGPSPDAETLARVADASSTSERRALDVERAVHSLYAAHMMRDRVGETFEGLITGVTKFGFFVNLGEPHVDGLVKLESLDEWFEFDDAKLRLFGRSGRVVSLGDRLQVRLVDANVSRRQIDLEVAQWGEQATAKASGASMRRTRRRSDGDGAADGARKPRGRKKKASTQTKQAKKAPRRTRSR